MINPPQPEKGPTIARVLFKGAFGVALVAMIALISCGFITAAYLSGQAPPSYAGTTENKMFDIEVSDITKQPVQIRIKHTYPITVSGSFYYPTDGVDRIDYNISIVDSGGEVIIDKESFLVAPSRLTGTSIPDTYDVWEDYDTNLAPGKYEVTLQSTHPLDYTITQKSKYEELVIVTAVLGVVGIVGLIGVGIAAGRKRKALAEQVPPPPPAAPYGFQGPAYVAGGVPYGQPVGTYGYQYAPARSPDVVTAYVCAKCGNEIQNPVVQGVITCERCGEKELVQQP